MEYKIIDAKENPRESVIEMTGQPVKFSLYEMEGNLQNSEKTVKELTAQVEVSAAKMANIEEHHPFVKDMSEQDLFTCHMYQEAKAIVKVGEKKIEEFRVAIETDKKALEDVYAALPEFKADVEKFDEAEMERAKPKHVGSEEKVEDDIKSDNQE